MESIPSIKNTKELKKILKCAFDITDLEVELILSLSENGMKVKEIQNLVKKDRTTIQKSLKNLLEKNLIFRESKCCIQGKRGRYYIYMPLGREELKKRVRSNIEEWYQELQYSISSL